VTSTPNSTGCKFWSSHLTDDKLRAACEASLLALGLTATDHMTRTLVDAVAPLLAEAKREGAREALKGTRRETCPRCYATRVYDVPRKADDKETPDAS